MGAAAADARIAKEMECLGSPRPLLCKSASVPNIGQAFYTTTNSTYGSGVMGTYGYAVGSYGSTVTAAPEYNAILGRSAESVGAAGAREKRLLLPAPSAAQGPTRGGILDKPAKNQVKDKNQVRIPATASFSTLGVKPDPVNRLALACRSPTRKAIIDPVRFDLKGKRLYSNVPPDEADPINKQECGDCGVWERKPVEEVDWRPGRFVAQPITGSNVLVLADTTHPPPTSFPPFYGGKCVTKEDGDKTCEEICAGIQEAKKGASKPKNAPGRYAKPKRMNWEDNLEKTWVGLTDQLRCNGYGQTMSHDTKKVVFCDKPDPPKVAALRERSLRLSRKRWNPVLQKHFEMESVDHATYKEPVYPHATKVYLGPKATYMSGFVRNNEGHCFVDLPDDPCGPSIDHIHPSVVSRFKVPKPVDYANALRPNPWNTTYNQTIGSTARIIMDDHS